MRPVFTVPHADPVAVLRRVEERLEAADRACDGTVFRAHAVLQPRVEERHFWSPHLYLEARLVDAEDEFAPEAPELRGRFAPHPNVWTMFIAIYAVLAIAALGGLIVGVSQWWLQTTPWALGVVPAAVALIGFVYGAVFIGQGLGASQMYELRAFVDRNLANGERAGHGSRS